MDINTFDGTLRAYSRKVPFRPFAVELVSGSRIVVEHPEALIFSQGVAVYIAPDKNISIFDSEGVVQFTTATVPATAG